MLSESMILKLHLHHLHKSQSPKISHSSRLHPIHLSACLSFPTFKPKLFQNASFSLQKCKRAVRSCDSKAITQSYGVVNDKDEDLELDYLAPDGEVYQKTLRLVECAMFAAISGLSYLLSSSLGLESYFGCFFALPIVLSSLRWGVGAARKTMVATSVLLFVLSGPVKALTYLLMHGFVGFSMGSFWRLRAHWGISIFLCTIVRAMGALGYVLVSSLLIEENILALITVNVHAVMTYVLASMGSNIVPQMNVAYAIFGFCLFLNCVFYVFLLHLLYAVFFTKFGMKASLTLPRWLGTAI